MNMSNNADQPAFPTAEIHCSNGVSKRELFTAMALIGLCASSKQVEHVPTAEARERIANAAIQVADKTLAELEKSK